MGHLIQILILGGSEESSSQLKSKSKYGNKDETEEGNNFPCRGNGRYKGLEASEMEHLEN